MGAALSIGIVGAGVMGHHHARVAAASTRAQLKVIVDIDLGRARALAESAGAIGAAGLEALQDCDGVIVAAPTEDHPDVVRSLHNMGLPVLVEKPLAATLGDVVAMVESAARADLPLMCGFVERFNPAIVSAFGLLDEQPIHLLAVRHSPPAPRVSVGAVHDLLIHDLDLVVRLCGTDFTLISAAAWAPPGGRVEEIIDASVAFTAAPARRTLATFSCDRSSQRKVRSFSISTSGQLIEVDLVRQNVTVYRHLRHEIADATYRSETAVDIPFVRHQGEPLALQLDHFLDLIAGEGDAASERDALVAPHRLAAEVLASAGVQQ